MRIHKLHLQTARLQELQRFYTQVLGLPLAATDSASFTLRIGDSLLHFSEAATGEEPYYHFAFNIPENQLAEAQQWLQQHVELLQHEGREVVDFPNWHAHSLYFYDPAGNVVELIARHQLPNAATAPFSASSLLCISEAGMPLPNAPAVAERLHTELGLPYFHEAHYPGFNALGDDHGLLLIVSEERNWFPTDKPSRMFALTVHAELPQSVSLHPLPYQIVAVAQVR